MAQATASVDIDVPVKSAYNQWTQFEDFPSIMTGVENVEQIDDTHVRWSQEIGGSHKSWTAEIFEQIPDNVIAWKSVEGDEAAGEVRFTELSHNTSRVELSIEYEPEGMMEKGGALLGLDNVRLSRDLNRFKEFVENQGGQPEGWRGTIRDRDQTEHL